MPRSTRPPPGFFDESSHPRRRTDAPSSGGGAGGAPVGLESGAGRGILPRPSMKPQNPPVSRPKRPPPGFFDESRHLRRRTDAPSSGSGAGGAPVELEPGGGRGNLPRPNMKRPPPDSFDESRHPRQRAAADTDAPSSGGGAGRCRDLSRAFGRCRALLDRLLRDEDGWIFAAPVDARALRLRDYYTVIADPMDLGTVLRRLERRRYADPPAFAADVRLTFSNAKSYNNPGDPVYESADELSGIFEDGWASIQAELPPPPPTDAERKLKFRDDLKGLPVAAQRTVAGFLKERGACQLEKRGKLEVDLGKADAATLDELDRVVAKHRAADSDVVAPSPECRNHERGQTEGPSPKS
ncbi:hypothetical protein SEVIR_5G252900v4 [Setaria viridis]|uniref:Bromo domain-containing protein n=1 Tax=Setaria viridis TaxID=4556 RepID=A0A4U6UMU1_SETVI|nr:transcription factor GTE4-like [Setaria viridis]TKW15673.1 hypothetical protein SEVIR_5G252900v2 [Setaria viridis]